MTKDQLYQALLQLCQEYGFTSEATYDHLHWAIESITPDEED